MSYRGILIVYLKPCAILLLLIIASVAGGLCWSAYLFLLTALLCAVPILNADLRLYLLVPVLLLKTAGKRINCPKCNPTGPVWSSHPDIKKD